MATSTVKPRILRQIDLAHSACAELREDFVWAKQSATGEGHFFTSAVQLTTTVSGAFGSVSTIVLSRNFCPS